MRWDIVLRIATLVCGTVLFVAGEKVMGAAVLGGVVGNIAPITAAMLPRRRTGPPPVPPS